MATDTANTPDKTVFPTTLATNDDPCYDATPNPIARNTQHLHGPATYHPDPDEEDP